MLRAEKAQVIDELSAVFDEAGVVVVTHYKGLTVAELSDLRTRSRAVGATFRVTKNKLAQRALDGTPFAPVSELFKGPTAIAFSKDPTSAPKIVAEFAKKNEKLRIVGGGLAGTLLDEALDHDIELVRQAVRGEDGLALAEKHDIDLTADPLDLHRAQPVERLIGEIEGLGHRDALPERRSPD